MTALLTRAAQALSARSVITRQPVIDGCAPDCFYDFICDSAGQYYRRECCYRPDCTVACGGWVLVGGC